MEEKNEPIRIFISYSREDEKYKHLLLKHLSIMTRKDRIKIWNDKQILAGSDIKQKLSWQLRNTDIGILLISSDFLASDFINDFEVPILLEQNKEEKTVIVPILIRPVYTYDNELLKFQGLPKDGKAISHWESEDEAWINIVSELARLIEKKENEKERIKNSNGLDIKKVKKLVVEGKMDIAIKKIEEFIKTKEDSHLEDLLILLSARLKRLERSLILGILSHDQEMLERNKITYSILNLLEEI